MNAGLPSRMIVPVGLRANAMLLALAGVTGCAGGCRSGAPGEGSSDGESESESETDTGAIDPEGPLDEAMPPLGERPPVQQCRLEGTPAGALPGLTAPLPAGAPAPSFPLAIQLLPAPASFASLDNDNDNDDDGNDDGALVVVEGDGKIWRVQAGEPGSAALIVDLGDRVDCCASRGLLAAAFEPGPSPAALYVHYHRADDPLRARVARLSLDPLLAVADPDSEALILEIVHDSADASGGGLSFDPAGMLLVGVGDDSSVAPQNPDNSPASDATDLRGAVLRLDVSAPGTGYAIPPDNPFVANPDPAKAGEILATGFHDPRTCLVDPQAAPEEWDSPWASWCVDVGSGARDELDALAPGKDYGWPRVEGYQCTGSGGECDPALLAGPHADYGFEDFDPEIHHCELRGGMVYRGEALTGPSLGLGAGAGLDGAVLFADRCSGRVWGLRPQIGHGAFEIVASLSVGASAGQGPGARAPRGALTLGPDRAGEPWVIDDAGALAPLVLDEHGLPGSLPTTVSATNCFPAAADLVPYQVASALWSDGLAKRRYMVLPPGEQARVHPDGRWSFPEGSLLIKIFGVGSTGAHSWGAITPVETRYMARKNGAWTFYSYRWREDLSDADLLEGSDARTLDGWPELADPETLAPLEWTFPGRRDCRACHGFASSRALGPTTEQLNREVRYADPDPDPSHSPDQAAQLEALFAAGLLDFTAAASPDPGSLPAIPDFRDEALPLDARARAYFHANCSHCHRPEWMRPDLRYPTALADTGLCEFSEFPSPWGEHIPRVEPGSPEDSILWLRMSIREEGQMPPLGTARVDTFGHALIGEWVESLSTCP